MAGWKPIGSIYDTIRKRWFGPGDVFHKGDWLPRLYAREFEHTDEEPNVTEQGSIPTPPPPAGGGADPRVEQLLRDVAELKSAHSGGGQDPRVEGLLDRVATVEGKTTRNTEGLVSARQVASEAKAVADGLASDVEQAAAKAQAATEAAAAATAKATQVADTANQAKLKAEDATAKALQAEAATGRVELKADSAESVALSARSAANSALTVANIAKRQTDKLAPLKIDQTYSEVRMNATLAKETANNAQVIAQGVDRKVEALTDRVQSAEASLSKWDSFSTSKLDNWTDILNQVTNGGLKIHAAQPISMSRGGVVSELRQADLAGSRTLSNRSTRDATILIAGPEGADTSTTETIVVPQGKACLVSGDGDSAVIHYPGKDANTSTWVANRTFSGNLKLFSGELELSSLIVKGKAPGI